MNTKLDLITEKFKVLLATIFPVEETVVETVVETVIEETPVVKLEEATLEDGTVISYEALEVGQAVNVVSPEDATLSPVPNGTYEIGDMYVTCVDGVITEVKEEPVEVIEPEVPEVAMEEEAPEVEPTPEEIEALIEGKVNEVKLAYEAKLVAQKAEFDAQVEALGNKFKETNVIQAPVEVEKKPLTYKERISVELSEKRKERVY